MSVVVDGPGFVDLTPYLDGGITLRPVGDADLVGEWLTGVQFVRPPSPPPPADPAWLVISRRDPQPGDEIAIGFMPDGPAGGVTEWRRGRIVADADVAAPLEGEVGWYVPAGQDHCPRCGDVNYDDPPRVCLTCTNGDPAYADGLFADGWSAEAGARLRELADAERDGQVPG